MFDALNRKQQLVMTDDVFAMMRGIGNFAYYPKSMAVILMDTRLP